MPKRARQQQPEDENDSGTGAGEDVLNADDLGLQAFIGKFSEARRVSVSRYKEASGRWSHLGSFPAELVNLDFLQERFRRGTYRLRLHDAAGQVLTQASSIEIDDPLDAPAAASSAAIAAPAAAAPGGSDLLAFVLQQAQRQHEMLIAMISKPAPSMNDALLLKLFERNGERQSSAGLDVKTAMDIFSKGMDVGKTAEGGGGLLGAAAPLLLPMLMDRLGRKRPAAADEEENEEMELPDVPLIEKAVRFLKPAAQANVDVGAITALTVQAARHDAGLGAVLDTVVNQPFLELLRLFGKVDPEMMTEPIAGWLQSFYSKLRDAIQGSEYSTRAARHSGNPPGHGTPGA